MGLDATIVERRLAVILEELKFLKIIKAQSYDEFLTDGKSLRATARAIETIAQSIIDVSSHIVAQKNYGLSDTYKGTIELLAKNHLISSDLASSLQKVIAMRNVLVHQYIEIDFGIVWDAIDSLLVDAPRFVRAIEKYLKAEAA